MHPAGPVQIKTCEPAGFLYAGVKKSERYRLRRVTLYNPLINQLFSTTIRVEKNNWRIPLA
jgi:hypothetical protein